MEFRDQMGNALVFSTPPKRIVSLVPSQTELLYDLGVNPVGQTVFCIHPADAFKSATKIGGTKKLRLDAIRALKPDLIIGNKEENDQTQIESLQQEFPVWMSDITTIDDALDMITRIGALIGQSERAIHLKLQIQHSLELIKNLFDGDRVAYLIWHNPIYAVGRQTFIHHVLQFAGFANSFGDVDRYPNLTEAELRAKAPQHVFLSSEPFPFKDDHIQHYQRICPTSNVQLVDGEMFSWYGSRMTALAQYLIDLKKSIYDRQG